MGDPDRLFGMAFVALFIIFLVTREKFFLLVGFLLGATWGSARIWSGLSLAGVRYSRSMSCRRAFCGDRVDLVIRVENRKILPVPWLEVKDEFPRGLSLLQKSIGAHHKPKRGTLFTSLFLGWYQRVTRRYTVVCNQRGCHTLGPARYSSGDPFGLYTHEGINEETLDLVVFPRVFPLHSIMVPSVKPLGNIAGRGWLYRDPMFFAGPREYNPGDPLNRIHWKASARTGRLQVREGQPVYRASAAICLDVATYPKAVMGVNPDLLEMAVSAAASVASHFTQRGWETGLFCNGSTRRHGRFLRIMPSGNPEQLGMLLEALAALDPLPAVDMTAFIKERMPVLPPGTVMVLVAAVLEGDMLPVIRGFKARAGRMVLVKVGGRLDERTEQGLGAPVYYAGGEDRWHELEATAPCRG